jgi:hypothetical protein
MALIRYGLPGMPNDPTSVGLALLTLASAIFFAATSFSKKRYLRTLSIFCGAASFAACLWHYKVLYP